ncbi:hypothetical protein GCM10027347_13720 [Larkinella harenae]
MKLTLSGFLLLMTVLVSCQFDSPVDPLTTGPEPEPYKVVRDSVMTGSYLGIAIDEEAASVYPKIQALQATKGVSGLHIVSNIFSDLGSLEKRIPLYQYILLDEKPGSGTGVQITIENQSVKVIYLNDGKKLSQWPEKRNASSSVRIGDSVTSLYAKLATISDLKAYRNKFQRISLLTKNLATGYDTGMGQSPQWYFGYSTGQDEMDQIQVHFRAGKVSKIYVDHYSKY